MKKLSIVVPVFNEQENIHEFYRRVTEVMAPLSYDYELLFIDDGSRDQSAAMIRELADKDPHVEGYLFPVTMAINWLLRVDWNTPRGMPSSPWTGTCSIRRK